jgi:YVTN family beta-propeller protein
MPATMVAAGALVFALASCGTETDASDAGDVRRASTATTARTTPTAAVTTTTSPFDGLPGMPPPLDANDIYAATRPGRLSETVAGIPSRVYVPNSHSDTVDVIDPATFEIVDHFAVGDLPQHVVPSWDLKTLWITNNLSNTVQPIDAATGARGPTIPVDAPYNLYFTPDGKFAIVVAERLQKLDFRDPHTMRLVRSVDVDCKGVDHLDFSADGRYLIASCEFAAKLLKLDVAEQQVVGMIDVQPGGMPQDVKLDPRGKVFYVADMVAGGVYTVDGDAFRVTGFIPTGAGAHGLYTSRDSKVLYVSNRDAGTVSLLDFATNRVAATWTIPGGSPDMGGVSADGRVLWLSGRYSAEVYAIDTTSGGLLARIPVGHQPHGLCVYPQPGRYSLGHTGVFR